MKTESSKKTPIVDRGLEGGIEEALNALSGPELCGFDRTLDRTLLPGGFFAGYGHRRLGCCPIRENMD